MLTGVNNIKIYTSMIAHELIYNKLRRDEILNNKISTLINIKKLREGKKEILFYGKDILDKIDELYEDKSNIYISKYGSYDLDDPPEFKDDPTLTAQIKDNISETVLIDLVNLSTYWMLRLGDEFKYFPLKDNKNSFFINYVYIINKISMDENGDTINSISTVKDSLIDYIENIPEQYIKIINNQMDGHNVNNILELYKKYYPNKYYNIYTIQELKNEIKTNSYNCSLIDIYLLSIIHNINILILQNRITTKNNNEGYMCIGPNIIESSRYILIYTIDKRNGKIYNLIYNGSKSYFKYNELPESFSKFISCKRKVKIKKIITNSDKKKIKLKK